MIRTVCLAVVAAVVIGPASAEPIVVRSGEHAEFTRFVVPLPAPVRWHLDRQGERYFLDIASAPELDISRVFDLIPKTRVSSVARAPRGIALTLACNCHALAREMRPGLIVIDVADGPGPDAAEPQPSLTLPWTGIPQIPLFMPERVSPPGLPPVGPPRLAEARALLEARIARAADQGLVELDPLPFDAPQVAVAAREVGLDALTSIDRDIRDDGLTSMRPFQSCPDPERLDVAQWGDARPFVETIGALRAELTGEFDAPDVQALNRLVRFYLANGFGREALVEIGAHPDLISDADWLRPLTDLVEGTLPDEPGPLSGMAICDGPVALWALLADPGLGKGREVNRAAILQSFAVLPAPVRTTVAPQLVSRFLVREDEEAARILRSGIARAGETEAAVAVMDARLAAAVQGAEPAGLTAAADAAGLQSAEALLLLIEGRIARGEPVEHARAVQAAGLALELRGTSLGQALARAHVLALGSAGDFDSAFASLVERPDEEARHELLSLLARIADDVTFLRYSLVMTPQMGDRLAEREKQAIGDRLIALGFADQAWRVVGVARTDRSQVDGMEKSELTFSSPGKPLHEAVGSERRIPAVQPQDADTEAQDAMRATVRVPDVPVLQAKAMVEERHDVNPPPLVAGAALIGESQQYRATLLKALE